jgi:hypothetical protein
MRLGASSLRGSNEALGEGSFTGGASTCDFRRELPLGEGFNERERAFTERIPALGEGPKSSSKSLHLLDISTSSEVLNEAI